MPQVEVLFQVKGAINRMSLDPATLTPEQIEVVRSVSVSSRAPSNFADFWQQTKDELQRIPLELTIEPVPASETSGDLEWARWSATSLGHRRISGHIVRPADSTSPLPIWVYGHGYGSIKTGTQPKPERARAGFVTVTLDARGFGLSRVKDDPGVPGWILHRIEQKEHYILRGAVADTIRAVEAARQLPHVDAQRTVLSGASFSGGLAVLAAPWIDDLCYVAVSVPTFGAYELRRTLVKRGSGHEINKYLKQLDHEKQRQVIQNLQYFDAVHAAPYIQVPASVGLGIVDEVVPGETVAAIYHAIGARDKELLDYPCSHSTHALAVRWEHWEQHIIDEAKQRVQDSKT